MSEAIAKSTGVFLRPLYGTNKSIKYGQLKALTILIEMEDKTINSDEYIAALLDEIKKEYCLKCGKRDFGIKCRCCR